MFTLCAMTISLKVYKFTSLHVVCDDDKFGSLQSLEVYTLCVMMISLEVYKFTHCV